MAGKVEQWLAKLSDPGGVNETFRPNPFTIRERSSLPRLLELAAFHNVRPATITNLKRLLKVEPHLMLDAGCGDVAQELLEQMSGAHLQDIGRGLLLKKVSRELMEDIQAQALPAVIVKGVDFAENAYGGLHLRTFSDIDLLVDPGSYGQVAAIMSKHGFRETVPHKMRMEKTERQWVRKDRHDNVILVELHTDLVHDPKLRGQFSLTYRHYADPAEGGVTPAARMTLAAVHGAASHLFGRLQYVVDGVMIARTGVHAAELKERAKRAGAVLPVATMLRLGCELYGCTHCGDLLSALGDIPYDRRQRNLITARMVLSAKGPNRWLLLPQRYAYRRLLG